MSDDKVEKFSASFKWLGSAQFLGVLNDNIFKLLVIFFLVEVLNLDRAATISVISMLFIIPFLLFSQVGGVLADKYSKRDVVFGMKLFEFTIMLLGFIAVYCRSSYMLGVLVFLMGTHSALLGPSKYGIIPELVPQSRLSMANGLIVGIVYMAIIIGTFIPTVFLTKIMKDNYNLLMGFCVFTAIAGIVSAIRINRTPAGDSSKRFSGYIVGDVIRTLRMVKTDKDLLMAMIGSAYFLFLGAFIQQNILLYAADFLHLELKEGGFLFPVTAIGIGIGALLSGKVSGRNVEFGIVPIGAVGLTVSTFMLTFVPPNAVSTSVIMFFTGLFSGLFIVPLDAFVQFRAPKDKLGEISGCSNFLGFTGVALSSGMLFFLTKVLHFSSLECFTVIGALTGVLAVTAILILPDFLVRFVVLVITRMIYRIKVIGLHNLPMDGPALIVSNHVTWVDALLISAVQQRRIRFMMFREFAENKWFGWLFKLMKVIPVSAADSPKKIVESLHLAREAMDDGYIVCIFAEGLITRNGNMHAFRSGFEKIVKGSNYPVIPCYLGGAWGSTFSYHHGHLLASLPSCIPYPITLVFGAPMPSESTTEQVRLAVSELSTEYFNSKKEKGRDLATLFIKSARRNLFRPAFADTTGRKVDYLQALAGAIMLSDRLRETVKDQRYVGILLPSSVGGVLANVAVTLLGKVPVNLNYTVSREAFDSSINMADIKTVITAEPFLKKLETLTVPEGAVYIEKLLSDIGGFEKITAALKAMFAPKSMIIKGGSLLPDDTATIIFSSGSTGKPKGIMLSHHNIISNIEAFQMIIRFNSSDKICGILPFFHSFGFTCTMWCPALKGIEAHYHPNPVDGAKIAEVVREKQITSLLATPTFLLAYMRKATKEDFASLRLLVTGAEKLKAKVADAFQERFGIRPMQGYGATELSPVVAFSVKDISADHVTQVGHKEGSVGHPVPGIAAKIVDPATGNILPHGEQGILMIKGPNVMKGYLKDESRTAEVIRDGWYDTGDICKIDKDGFIFILDRVSRYSKIGGEMVPHMAVEDKINHVLGTMMPAVFVSGAPDEKKGEQLVLLYTAEAGESDKLYQVVQDSDLPNLWKPKKDNFFKIEKVPTLGSGKLDLKLLKELALKFVSEKEKGS